jgi:hypothetical protein
LVEVKCPHKIRPLRCVIASEINSKEFPKDDSEHAVADWLSFTIQPLGKGIKRALTSAEKGILKIKCFECSYG